MNAQEKTLSRLIDEAREMEAHYRALLLFWKERRQRLESQIPNSGIFEQILEIANRAWRKSNDAN